MLAYSLCGCDSIKGIIQVLTEDSTEKKFNSRIQLFYQNMLNCGDVDKRDVLYIMRVLLIGFTEFSLLFQNSFLEKYGGKNFDLLAKIQMEYLELKKELENILEEKCEWEYENITINYEELCISSTFCENEEKK